MPRIVPCPGSLTIEAQYERLGEDQSAEGNVAHDIAHKVLTGQAKLTDFLGQSILNVYIDQEFLHAVSIYVEECSGIEGAFFEMEMPPIIYSGHNLTGKPDFWYFNVPSGTLYIKDLKFGYGWVEPYENWQLLHYANLVVEYMLRAMPNFEALCKTIELTIVQPRVGHPEGPTRRWSFDGILMRNYRNQMMHAINCAIQENPETVTGKHCRYCKALLRCNSKAEALSHTLEIAGRNGHQEIDNDQVSLELDIVTKAYKILEQRLTALEELALDRTKKGQTVPGYEARQTWGNLSWNVDPLLIGDSMGKDLRQETKPITPTQAIQRGLLDEDFVKTMASRKPGGMKLKRIDDARIKRILDNGR